MKLPETILVGDTLWPILMKRVVRHRDFPKESLRGLCDFAKETISIQKGQEPLEEIATLIHELFHAISEEYEFDIPHFLIEKVERPIARIILDNFL